MDGRGEKFHTTEMKTEHKFWFSNFHFFEYDPSEYTRESKNDKNAPEELILNNFSKASVQHWPKLEQNFLLQFLYL